MTAIKERRMTLIKELSERIARNGTIVDSWLTSTKAPAPSFEPDAPEEFPATAGDLKVEAARLALLEDTNALNDLLLGPAEVVRRLCWGAVDNAVQQCIYQFRVLDSVPLIGGANYTQIATQVGLPRSQVEALVRQSTMNGILYEDAPDHVVHTAASALLLRNRPMMDWYGHCVSEVFPASAKLAEALRKHPASVAAEDSAFGVAFGTELPFYRWIGGFPDRQARFQGAMEAVGKGAGHSLEHIVQGYPWGELGESVVVDVGGGSGTLSVALARAHPNLNRLVVQDSKATVEKSSVQLPAELSSRIQFMTHDFFEPQPITGADVYIMRHIGHNWSTENCTKIFQHIASVMKPSSKILLVDVVVLPSNMEESKMAERYMRNSDIIMLQMLNTQERSEAEWRDVFSAANSDLKIDRILKPKGSWDSIIEVSLRPIPNSH